MGRPWSSGSGTRRVVSRISGERRNPSPIERAAISREGVRGTADIGTQLSRRGPPIWQGIRKQHTKER
jgi:hypothetical protein